MSEQSDIPSNDVLDIIIGAAGAMRFGTTTHDERAAYWDTVREAVHPSPPIDPSDDDARLTALEACVREADADDGDRPRADDFVGLLDCLASDLKDHPGVPPSIRAWAPWIERRAAMVRRALVPDEGEKR